MTDQTASLANAEKFRIRLLFTQNGAIQLGAISIAVIYVWLSRNTVPLNQLACWSACYGAQYVARMALYRRFNRAYRIHLDTGSLFSPDYWETLAMRFALFSGLCWGAASSVMLPSADINYQAFMGFFLGGVTAAASVAYGASFKTARGFVFTAIIPFIIALALASTPYHFEMALLLSSYVLLYNRLVSQLNGYLIQALKLGFEKEVLVEELREVNQRLIRSARMAALGEMAGGIAHEINNPLAVIKGKNQLIQFQLEEKQLSVEKLLPLVENIDLTVMKIVRIVSGMKTFSRGGEDEGENADYVAVSVDNLVLETVEMCRSRFADHNIALEYKAVGAEVEVECRSLQLGQVLLNLLNNAFDAVADRPERWVRITVEETADALALRVADSGTGVPDKIKNKIGDAAFTTKPAGKGTGLGLRISATIIKDHQGTLKLDPTQPHTTFVIHLPKKQPRSLSLLSAA